MAGTLPSMELDVLGVLALPPEVIVLLDIEEVGILFELILTKWEVSEFSCGKTGDETSSACDMPVELYYQTVV